MTSTRGLWGSWVIAGAAGELVGLGVAGVIMAGGASIAAQSAGPSAMVIMFAATALAGVLEGAIVGAIQVAVLRRHVPAPGSRRTLRRGAWA
jgi:hypothetical protein